MTGDVKPQLRWFRKYYWTARAGSYAHEWPRNAVLEYTDELQFLHGSVWINVPVVHGEKPEAP